jgi:gas vesicle protein
MTTSEKFLYLIAGTGIGATMGLLFAPRAGSELRDNLTSQAHRGVDLITGKVDEGRRFISEKGINTSTVRNIVDRGKQTLNDSVESVRNRFNESVESGLAEYESQRERHG